MKIQINADCVALIMCLINYHRINLINIYGIALTRLFIEFASQSLSTFIIIKFFFFFRVSFYDFLITLWFFLDTSHFYLLFSSFFFVIVFFNLFIFKFIIYIFCFLSYGLIDFVCFTTDVKGKHLFYSRKVFGFSIILRWNAILGSALDGWLIFVINALRYCWSNLNEELSLMLKLTSQRLILKQFLLLDNQSLILLYFELIVEKVICLKYIK